MIDKANIKNIYRLSPLQGGMLFHALYNEAEGSYFEQGIYRIGGVLDVRAFEKAWNSLVDRHDALRTAFVFKGTPEPLQIVLKSRPLDFRYVDLQNLTEEKRRERIDSYCAEDKARGFDLTTDPLLRIALFTLSENDHVMALSFHHIIMDGWCQGILAGEFTALYGALREGRSAHLPPAPQYREYIRWLDRQDKEGAIAFWGDRLNGFNQPTYFPRRSPKETNSEGSAGVQENVHFSLTAEETTALRSAALRSGVTLSTLVQGVWGILLSRLNETDDALFLSTVSGRPHDLDNAQNIVGLFINALPVRVRFNEEESFADLVARLQQEAGESQSYQFAPLAEIQGTLSLKREPANTLLVFENYPFNSTGDEGTLSIVQEAIDERTNYDLTVQIHPDEELSFGIAFDPAVIDRAAVSAVQEWMREAVAIIADNPEARVGKFKVQSSKFKKEEVKGERKPLQVSVAATFTADSALPFLSWWLWERGYAPQVEIAPYNQVYQQLLDPGSPLARTDGFGILAVRFEDWIRDLGDESEDEIIDHLRRSYPGYIQAIDGFAGKSVLIHLLLPTDSGFLPTSVADAIAELREQIVADAEGRKNLFILDLRDLSKRYALPQTFDAVADRAGHIPYTSEANAAIGTAIARKVLSRDQHPFKVIAVDCDNTLWRGVCGEDGATGVQVYGGYRALQQFLIERYEEGFLIVLCSKNNEEDVWEVFEKNEGMILRRQHVVAQRINWRPKSGNLKELADELNVGINSFIFIDDSGMECAEVRENAPEVLTLHLPELEEAIPRFVSHIWGLDKWQITDEDRNRSGMYVAEQQRQQNQEQATSLQEFLSSLDLKIVMAPVADHQVPRLSQLTQRTNQFNISTIRRDELEIEALRADENHICWIVTVQDRFGEYGLVGAMICRRDPDTLVVDTLLLSCRVLGRGVEEAILTGMRRYAQLHGLTELEALFIPTKKNAPGLHFLETWIGAGGSRETREDGTIIFRRSIEELPDGVPFGEFDYRTEPLSQEEGDEKKNEKREKKADARPIFAPSTEGEVEKKSSTEGEQIAEGWEIDLREVMRLTHATYYLPFAYSTGVKLLRLPLGEVNEADGSEHVTSAEGTGADYVPPTTPDEIALTTLFQEVLHVDAVGLRDDFFDLGGHSLTAVVLLSRIYYQFQTEITLREIFENPTPELLLERIRGTEPDQLLFIEPLPRQEYYPVSHAQRRLWALDDIQSDGGAYIMGGGTLIEGDLSVDALEEAFNGVIRRHESLRTGIVLIDDEPVQQIVDDLHFAIRRIDLTTASLDRQAKEERAASIVKEEEIKRFDLATPPLLRATLIDLGDRRFLLAIFMHHIIADGWSYPILMNELTTLYKAYRSGDSSVDPENLLPPLRIHYKEYCDYQRRELAGERAREDQEFWLKHLAAPLPILELPTDHPRPAQPDYRGGTVRLMLDRQKEEAIRKLCSQERITLFMFLMASVRFLLWRYTGEEDAVIGVPVAGRDHPDLVDQIGFYVNTLALRRHIDPEKPFTETLRESREHILEAFSHRAAPFDLVVGALQGIERNTGRSPVFDVMVALQNNQEFEGEIDGLRFQPFGDEAGAGKFDLVFNFKEGEDGIGCELEYRAELFERETIERIGKELDRLIGEITIAPTATPRALSGVLRNLNAEVTERLAASIPEGTIIDRFAEIVAQHPNRIAVAEGEKTVSYAELDRQSTIVADSLSKMGVRKGEIVAVLLERGIDLIATMLGVMKRGAIYLPTDPAWPESRIRTIVEDSRAVLAVVRSNDLNIYNPIGSSELPSSSCRYVTPADFFREESAQKPSTSEEQKGLHADDPAYLIYTSGSTGKPKGVVVSGRGFVNMISAQIETFGVTAEDRVLQFASPAFDASLSEIFMALLTGATLTIPRRDDLQEIESFLTLLEGADVSVATIPPVYLRAIDRRPLPTLRVLITAGEEAPKEHLFHYAASRPGLTIFNAYGPTECSVCATIHRVDLEQSYAGSIPIGAPISGVGACIVDGEMRPLPDGVAGELILYGTGLADGYINDPAMTDERFPRNAWLGDVRCYRTGDRARRLPSGEFQFLGRIDNQVKIRGHRVEPEEVRGALLRIPSVKDAVLIVVDESGLDKSLIAFVCGEGAPDSAELSRQLAGELPAFLIPQSILPIDSLPMTVNGKVDKKKLEELYRNGETSVDSDTEEKEGERTEIESALAVAFAEVLLRDRVGLHDDFFMIGGDSMKAIRLRTALRRLGYEVRSRHIFEGGSIAGIAPFVEPLASSVEEESMVEGSLPLTPIQQWSIERLGLQRMERFGLPLVVDSAQPVDTETLRRALLDVVNHHDVLRATAGEEDNVLTLRANPPLHAVTLQEFDLRVRHRDSTNLKEKIDSILERLSCDFTFDGISPLFNAGLIRTPDLDMVLLAPHHLLTDALSLDILLDDLNTAYAARRERIEPTFQKKSASFGSWGGSIQRFAESISDERRREWREIAERVRSAGRLFAAGEVNGAELTSGGSFVLTIDREQTELLREERRRGIEIRHILLAALRRAVEEIAEEIPSELSERVTDQLGGNELPVMIESHGREGEGMPDVTGTVGWFTALYPLLLTGEGETLRDELRGIKENLTALQGREGEYGALRYGAEDILLREELRAFPQISFNYLGEYFEEDRADGAGTNSTEAVRPFGHTAYEREAAGETLTDLELHALIENGVVKIRCRWGNGVPNATAEAFRHCYRSQIDDIVAALREGEPVEARLIALPFVGGDAGSFVSLGEHLSSSIEILPLELPGHGDRLRESPLQTIADMVADLAEQMASYFDLPYVLFGHSMGALLARELAHHIGRQGLPMPELVICSGAAAPQYFSSGKEGLENIDAEMIAAHYADGHAQGNPVKGMNKEEVLERKVAAVQADMEAVQVYRYAERENLEIPILVLHGTEDNIPMELIAEWKNETKAEVSFCGIAGRHDFPITNARDTANVMEKEFVAVRRAVSADL